MNTHKPIDLLTVAGLVQKFDDEAALLNEYNRYGRLYELRDGKNGRELWHKGQRRIVGFVREKTS